MNAIAGAAAIIVTAAFLCACGCGDASMPSRDGSIRSAFIGCRSMDDSMFYDRHVLTVREPVSASRGLRCVMSSLGISEPLAQRIESVTMSESQETMVENGLALDWRLDVTKVAHLFVQFLPTD